jgi:ferritin-like metal-binding protein YciE
MTIVHNIKTLHQLLDEECRNFSIAEKELHHAIPVFIAKSSSVKLKTILQKYYEQIKQHMKLLDSFFEEENITYLNTGNSIMHAFITDAEDKMSNCSEPMVRDACILASIQNINHYKIAAYGTSAAFTETLGMTKASYLFHQFESNEKLIDKRLSMLAIQEINKNARAAFLTS